MYLGKELIKVQFKDYFGKRVKVTFLSGNQLIGKIDDYTASIDNDDEGEYLTICPEEGKLKGEPVAFYENEIKTIAIL